MKKVKILLIIAVLILSLNTAMHAKFEPNWESLKKNPIPGWMLDAKFGIYTHWGVYSVPAYKGNTYVKNMYAPAPKYDRDGYQKHHIETYGPIEDFGYTDFIPMFTAPKFNAAEWVQVMKGSGAKFGGICLVHHDGFCLWDSKFTRWNSKDMGPKRDIYGEIAREIRKQKMKLVATFHHGRTYGYPYSGKKNNGDYTEEQKKKWDIFKPEYADFYRNPATEPKEKFGKEWEGKIREVIEKYYPDVIWFDGLSGQIKNDVITEKQVLTVFADYFNKAKKDGKEVVICNKLPASKKWNFPLGFGLRCYENGRDMEADPEGYWLSDRAISYPWSYVKDKVYNLTYDHHIRSLVDIAARGGIFFLSLTPKGDGSIPDEEKEIMSKIGAWLKINGEAIYSTRRWKKPAEGTPISELVVEKKSKKGKMKFHWDWKKLRAKGEDFRFLKKKNTLYTVVLGWPKAGMVKIKTLAKGNVSSKGIKNITMLGSKEKIKWEQKKDGLTIYFPKKKPCDVAYSFRIEPTGKLLE